MMKNQPVTPREILAVSLPCEREGNRVSGGGIVFISEKFNL